MCWTRNLFSSWKQIYTFPTAVVAKTQCYVKEFHRVFENFRKILLHCFWKNLIKQESDPFLPSKRLKIYDKINRTKFSVFFVCKVTRWWFSSYFLPFSWIEIVSRRVVTKVFKLYVAAVLFMKKGIYRVNYRKVDLSVINTSSR